MEDIETESSQYRSPKTRSTGRRSRTIEYKPLPKLIERRTLNRNMIDLSSIVANGLTTSSNKIYQTIMSVQPQTTHTYISQPIQPSCFRSIFRKPRRQSKCMYGFNCLQNKRTYNEDRVVCIPTMEKPFVFGHQRKNWEHCSYFAVFDGHGGSGCAQFLKQNLHLYILREREFPQNVKAALFRSLQKIEKKFMENSIKEDKLVDKSGACAIVCIVTEKTTYVASIGDCHGIALMKGKGCPDDINVDHKPSNKQEFQRVIANGGKLLDPRKTVRNFSRYLNGWEKSARIFPGCLNMTRAIGDIEAKLKRFGGLPNVISAQPDIYELQTSKIQYIVLGSDGLFEGLTKQQIHRVYQETDMQQANLTENIARKIAHAACKTTSDNVSSIFIIP